MDEQELKQRTKRFALRVIKLVDALPKTTVGRAIANQYLLSHGVIARTSCPSAGMSKDRNARCPCHCEERVLRRSNPQCGVGDCFGTLRLAMTGGSF